MLVQVTTANRPSRFFPEVADPRPPAPLVAPVHCLRAFRVVTLAVPDQPDVVNVEADEVFVGVLEQLYPSPSVLRNVNNTLNTAIADSLQLYQQLHSHLPSHSTAASELDNTLSSYMLNVRRTTATTSSPYSDLNGFIDIHTRIVADAQLKIQTAIDELVGKLRIDYNELLESGSHAVKPFDHIVQEHDEPSTALAELEDLVNNAPSSTSIAPIKDNKKARKTRKDKGGKRSVPNPANFTEKKGDDVVSNGGSVGVAMKEDGEGSTATGGVEEEEEGALDEMEVDT
ncbi:hypothetical protein HDU79_001373 [Rhizoclosmatium sp. JEL0117]|nr:hypothetical protein HDU79_001373 [Rhizoclosmatium sp. JEL0117]